MKYPIAETNPRRQELLADFLNPLTLRSLEDISLPEGATILDLGCGRGETSLLLAARFPGTTVTGVDQNEALIEAANSTKAWKYPHLHFVTGDALHLPFDDGCFDFVFARYILLHIPDHPAALREMVRVCKPGGLVFAQEPDANSLASWPESWAYPRSVEVINALFADALLGRKLIRCFNNVKLTSLRHRAACVLAGDDSTLKTFYVQSAASMKEAILKKGLMTEIQYREWIAELTRVEGDPDTVLLGHHSISVWGTKQSQ